MDTEFVDSREAAGILQVSAPRVATVIIQKAGISHKRVGRWFLFRRIDIEKLAQERGGKVGPGRPKKQVEA
jgi:hypothetical protein